FEGTVELGAEAGDFVPQGLAAGGPGLGLDEVVGEVEGGHHRDALEADHVTGAADIPHTPVGRLGRLVEWLLHLAGAVDPVFVGEDADDDGIARVSISRLLRREIIASTRDRASSFFSSSWLRSRNRVDSRSRRRWLSAWSCSHRAISLSILRSSWWRVSVMVMAARMGPSL